MSTKLNSWDRLRFRLIKRLAGSTLVLLNSRAPTGETAVVFVPPMANVYVASCDNVRVILTDDRLKGGRVAW